MWPHRRQPTRLPRPWDSSGKNTGVGCHFLLQCMKVKSEREVVQSCLTLRDPMDCSPPGSSVHGIFQAKVLEWGAIAFSDIVPSIREFPRRELHMAIRALQNSFVTYLSSKLISTFKSRWHLKRILSGEKMRVGNYTECRWPQLFYQLFYQLYRWSQLFYQSPHIPWPSSCSRGCKCVDPFK